MKAAVIVLLVLVAAFVVALTCGAMGDTGTGTMVDAWTTRLKQSFGGPPAVPLANLKPRPPGHLITVPATPWVVDIRAVDTSGLVPSETPVRAIKLRLRSGAVRVDFEPGKPLDGSQERGVAVHSKLDKPLDITVRSGGGRLILTNTGGASAPAQVELLDSR